MLLTGLPVGNGTPPVFHSDLLEDILEVKLHGIKADFENDGNFPVGLARRDPAENLFFPFAQYCGRLSRSLRGPRRGAPHVA